MLNLLNAIFVLSIAVAVLHVVLNNNIIILIFMNWQTGKIDFKWINSIKYDSEYDAKRGSTLGTFSRDFKFIQVMYLSDCIMFKLKVEE